METQVPELRKRISEILRSGTEYPPSVSEARYDQARDLVWGAIRANPTDRELYRLLIWEVEVEHGFSSLERQKAAFYEIYKYAADHDPAWADARSFLGVADADSGRCELARQRFLEGLKLGDTPSEVAACLSHYIWTTRLSILESSPHPRCGPGLIAPIADAVDRLREDWENIASNITDLESRIAPDAHATYQRLRLKMHRLEAGATLLRSVLTEEQWNRLQIHHLSYLAWPFTNWEAYDPANVAATFGLREDWQKASLLERLALDRTLQQSLRQLDVAQGPEEEVWVSAPLDENRDHVMRELWARGEFDRLYEMLSTQLENSATELSRTREKLESSPAWASAPSEMELEMLSAALEDPLIENIEGIRYPPMDFIVAVSRHMRSLHTAIDYCHDLDRLSYLIRIAVRDQPWLGRQLARRANICEALRSWLQSEGILRFYREDTFLVEIDEWLTLNNWEPRKRDLFGQPDISTDATRMSEAIQQFVNEVEQFVVSADQKHPVHGLDKLLGANIWKWLPDDSQYFLTTGEAEYLNRVLRSRRGVPQPADWSGIYLPYEKALETTLKENLWRHWSRPGKPIKDPIGLGSYERLPEHLRVCLPAEASEWADELEQRIREIKPMRNRLVHEKPITKNDYERMRHLLLGTWFDGRRTVSLFWLTYAISSLLDKHLEDSTARSGD